MKKRSRQRNRQFLGFGCICASLALGCGGGRVAKDALGSSDSALPLSENSPCELAQAIVGGFPEESWDALPMSSKRQETQSSFVASKPKIEDGQVVIQAFFPEPSSTPSALQQVWCKLKTGKAIGKANLGVNPTGDEMPCAAVHEYLLGRVLLTGPAERKASYVRAAQAIRFEPDRELFRGDEWLRSVLKVERHQNGEILVQATALQTAEWIPLLGGNHYCKLLSLQGLRELLDGITLSQIESPLQASEYTVALSPGALYPQGMLNTTTIQGDAVDLYVPLTQSTGSTAPKLVAAIFLQGGKVDKAHYSAFARLLSSYGFAVAVPAHNSLFGKNFIEQKVANQVWDYLKDLNQDPESALYQRLDATRFALLGHSLGGLAGLNILQDKCGLPTCLGSYRHPPELSALVVYGTNTRGPLGGLGETDTRGIPVLFLQGDRDGKAKPQDTLITFRDKTRGHPKILATLHGANHYGITNTNNPAGADKDATPPTLAQTVSQETLARWAGLFLRFHAMSDQAAGGYVYQGQGDAQDSNIDLLLDLR